MSAADIAAALQGHRSGDGWLCRCPVPSHGQGKGDRSPSLLVKDGDTSVVVTCFGGCDRRDVIDELRRRGLLDRAYVSAVSEPEPNRRNVPAVAEPEPDPEAMRLWLMAQPITGSLGERYLREHRLIGLKALPPTLRFLPETVYPHSGFAFPALIAVVQRPDRKKIAAQLTYLRPGDAAKAPLSAPRLTIGRLGTGAIRLAGAGEVLGLAEGMETALAAMELTGVPTWASLGARRLSTVTIPDTVRELHVFVDNDEPGNIGAEKAAERHTAMGRLVRLYRPPAGVNEYADLLKVRRERSAA